MLLWLGWPKLQTHLSTTAWLPMIYSKKLLWNTAWIVEIMAWLPSGPLKYLKSCIYVRILRWGCLFALLRCSGHWMVSFQVRKRLVRETFCRLTYLLWCRLDNVVADLPYTLIMRFHYDSWSIWFDPEEFNEGLNVCQWNSWNNAATWFMKWKGLRQWWFL